MPAKCFVYLVLGCFVTADFPLLPAHGFLQSPENLQSCPLPAWPLAQSPLCWSWVFLTSHSVPWGLLGGLLAFLVFTLQPYVHVANQGGLEHGSEDRKGQLSYCAKQACLSGFVLDIVHHRSSTTAVVG